VVDPDFGSNLEKLTEYVRDYLEPLRDLLEKSRKVAERERDAAGKQPYVCWDWDLIKALINFDTPTEVFASAMKALSAYGQGSGKKVLILDGAKLEMSRDLAQKAGYARRTRLSGWNSPAASVRREPVHGVLSVSGWESLRKNVDLLLSISVSVQRLEQFLSEESITLSEVDENFARIPSSHLRDLPQYGTVLNSFRDRTGSLRNRADTINVVRMLVAHEEGVPGQLVTGTYRILQEFPDISTDPFTSLVGLLLAAQMPDPETRIFSITAWLEKINALINEFYTLGQTIKAAKRPLTRQKARFLLDSLKIVSSDKSLSPLLSILGRAVNYSRDHVKWVKDKARDQVKLLDSLPDSALRNLELRIGHLIDRLIDDPGRSLAELGLRWRTLEKSEEYGEWLIASKSRDLTILSLQTCKSYYSIAWPVELRVEHFLHTVENLVNRRWVPRPKELLVEALFSDRTIKSWEPLRRARSWEIADRVSFPQKTLVSLRVITDRVHIYFEQGSVDASHASIVAVVSWDRNASWFINLYNESSTTFIPDRILKDSVFQRIAQILETEHE
jgi:hypothetical protein